MLRHAPKRTAIAILAAVAACSGTPSRRAAEPPSAADGVAAGADAPPARDGARAAEPSAARDGAAPATMATSVDADAPGSAAAPGRPDGGGATDLRAAADATPPAIGVGPSVDFAHGKLMVDPGGRTLRHEDGTPFFYLGDTAWELFHRLGRADAETYLENRRAKGFTVIQAVMLSELGGIAVPNANGDLPFDQFDTDKPNEKYFANADAIVDIAAGKGLVIGVLPSWGDKLACIYNCNDGEPEVFSPGWKNQGLDAAKARAYRYGKFLAARYKGTPNVLFY